MSIFPERKDEECGFVYHFSVVTRFKILKKGDCVEFNDNVQVVKIRVA